MVDGSQYTDLLFLQNPHIYVNKDKTEFYCKTCNATFKSKNGATNHCKAAHNMDIYGNTLAVSPPAPKSVTQKTSQKPGPKTESGKTDEVTEEELDVEEKPDDTPRERELKKMIRDMRNNAGLEQTDVVAAVQNEAYIETVKELTTKAASIVTNYKLMFTYFEAKRLRIIPPHWDFERTILESFASFLKSIGFSIETKIAKDGLPQSVIEFHLAVEQDWKKFDLEQNGDQKDGQ